MDRIQTPTAPTTGPVDVATILTAVAAVLRETPRRILTENHLLQTVLTAAGDNITTTQLRPVWAALPHHPAGDEHAEYAALLTLTAQGL